MKKIISTLFVCSIIALTSCSTVYKTASSTDVETSVTTYPEVADLDVQTKISETKSWNFVPFHIGEPKLSTVKGNLIAEVLKAHNADILLEPQFSFQKTPYKERILTVTGYPATYKNFRKATANDLEAIKVCRYANVKKKYNDQQGHLFGILKK